MGRRGIIQVAAGFAAAAMIAACVPGEQAVAVSGSSAGAPTTSSAAPTPEPVSRVDPSLPAGTAVGTVVLRTRTESGTALRGIPVHLILVQPCVTAAQGIPLDAVEVLRMDAVTDAFGTAVFTAPVGCYRFGADAPPDRIPLPDTRTLSVAVAAHTVAGVLRFVDTGSAFAPVCTAAAITEDLGILGEFDIDWVTVAACDGRWAVIAWDVAGDTRRVARRTVEGWTIYTFTPRDTCWGRAAADGAPPAMEQFFAAC